MKIKMARATLDWYGATRTLAAVLMLEMPRSAEDVERLVAARGALRAAGAAALRSSWEDRFKAVNPNGLAVFEDDWDAKLLSAAAERTIEVQLLPDQMRWLRDRVNEMDSKSPLPGSYEPVISALRTALAEPQMCEIDTTPRVLEE